MRPRWMPSPLRLAFRAALLAWLAVLLVFLGGCGGGDADEDDTRQQIPIPPACAASATRCL